jgi:hypothetical protein
MSPCHPSVSPVARPTLDKPPTAVDLDGHPGRALHGTLGRLDYSMKVGARDGRTGILKAPALVSENYDTRIKIIE